MPSDLGHSGQAKGQVEFFEKKSAPKRAVGTESWHRLNRSVPVIPEKGYPSGRARWPGDCLTGPFFVLEDVRRKGRAPDEPGQRTEFNLSMSKHAPPPCGPSVRAGPSSCPTAR